MQNFEKRYDKSHTSIFNDFKDFLLIIPDLENHPQDFFRVSTNFQ
jgi:hypothetical protein